MIKNGISYASTSISTLETQYAKHIAIIFLSKTRMLDFEYSAEVVRRVSIMGQIKETLLWLCGLKNSLYTEIFQFVS